MRLRAIPPDMAADRVAEVDAQLEAIARSHAVAIPFAIESGSRAWGFPSPDSDYDCRFLFVRAADDYLSPWQKRDVIETPLVGDLDVNGWDLGKALKLLLRGNAVVIEWLTSPVIYGADRAFRDELIALAGACASRDGLANHYLHLGEKQRRTYFADGRAVQLKKIFYALRPAAALRWLRLHPGAAIAPMDFPTLIREADPPRDVLAISNDLVLRKAVTRELGTAPLPGAIEHFIDSEFALARDSLPSRRVRVTPEARRAAEALFRNSVSRLGPCPTSTSASPEAKSRR